jgi:hypothetical protein
VPLPLLLPLLLLHSFVWFISPEFDLPSISQVAQQMRPALQLFFIHNGHMPDTDFDRLSALSTDLPLVGMAPHVASFVSNRLQQKRQQQQQQDGTSQQQQQQQHLGASTVDWLLPTWPFEPAQQQPCSQVGAHLQPVYRRTTRP